MTAFLIMPENVTREIRMQRKDCRDSEIKVDQKAKKNPVCLSFKNPFFS